MLVYHDFYGGRKLPAGRYKSVFHRRGKAGKKNKEEGLLSIILGLHGTFKHDGLKNRSLQHVCACALFEVGLEAKPINYCSRWWRQIAKLWLSAKHSFTVWIGRLSTAGLSCWLWCCQTCHINLECWNKSFWNGRSHPIVVLLWHCCLFRISHFRLIPLFFLCLRLSAWILL